MFKGGLVASKASAHVFQRSNSLSELQLLPISSDCVLIYWQVR